MILSTDGGKSIKVRLLKNADWKKLSETGVIESKLVVYTIHASRGKLQAARRLYSMTRIRIMANISIWLTGRPSILFPEWKMMDQ